MCIYSKKLIPILWISHDVIYTLFNQKDMNSNLGKNWSSSLCKLVNLAMNTAQDSCLSLRHGAVLFSSKKQVHCTSCNGIGDKICGFDVPSLHAEANCMKPIYNRAGRFGHRYRGRGEKRCQKVPFKGQ